MAIFGIPTRKDIAALKDELDALKAERYKYQPWQLETAEAEKWNQPDPSVYKNQADLYRTLSWVMTAVDITASTTALVPFSVMSAVGEQEPREIVNHPFEMLLRHPNELDSRFEFLYATVALWKLTGNAYWWLNRANENAAPTEMWVIPSHMIEPIPDGRMYLDGYAYSPGNGNTIALENWEIVDFRRFNPFSRFRGLSAIESLALVAQGDIGMQEYNTKLFKDKGGQLSGILAFKSIIETDQWKKIKQDKRDAASKREDMMLNGVGDGGVEWLQNAFTQKDMEFLEGRKFNRTEIYGALAPGLESMTDPSATEANANAGERVFMGKNIYPMQVMMAEKISNSILPAYGENLIAEFEDVRISDRQLELQERAADEKIMTLRELRKTYNQLEPLGDERDDLLPVQITAQTGQPESPAPVIVQSNQPDVDQTQPDTIQGQEPPIDADNPDADNNALKADLDKWKRIALKKVGKAVPFESFEIPDGMRLEITRALSACKSEADVRGVFAKHAAAKPKASDVLELARAMNRAVEELAK